MKRLVFLFLICASPLLAQYVPTKAQQKQLEKQKEKVMALQIKANRLQTKQVFEAQQMMTLCRETAAKNGWPADITCNPDTLVFAAPPPRPQIPPAPAPKEKDEKHN